MDLPSNSINCFVRTIRSSSIYQYQERWESLQLSSELSCFLSWEWIQAWTSSTVHPEKKLLCVEAQKDDKTLGLAFFVMQTKRGLFGKKLKQLWLHRNGKNAKDQIWIEHNNFMVTSQDNRQIRQKMFEALMSQTDIWDEVYIGMSEQKELELFDQLHEFSRVLISSPSYIADLSTYDDLDSYLSSLSKNTRAQIKRAHRGLNALGDIELSVAYSDEEKRNYLNDIAIMHREKWGKTIHGSGFNNPTFVAFHEKLIFEDHNLKSCRLYKLSQNNRALGYVYLLINNNSWYFYLSAIKFHHDPKIKIGLLLHSMVIEKAINEGIKTYDFLAGEAQYKKSLSNTEESCQKLVCYYRPTNYMLVREKLRKVKHLLSHRQGTE